MSRLPSFLRDRTLLLLAAPILAVIAVLGAARLDATTPAERRAERASTTTTTATTTTAPPAGAPADGAAPGAAVAAGGDLAAGGFAGGGGSGGAGVSDDVATELTGALLDFPSAQVESAVLEAPAAPPVTAAPATAAPPATEPPATAPTTGPPTTATTTVPTTTVPTSTVPPVRPVTRSAVVQLDCRVLSQPGDSVTATFASSAIVGISTYDRFPAGGPLPFALRIAGPVNSTGPATEGQLSQLVFLAATARPTPQSFSTLNTSPYAALANFLVPDDPRNQALVGQLSPGGAAGAPAEILLSEVRTDRSGASQRCVPTGGPVAIVASVVADPNTTTTTIALPTPVVSEAPVAALLPLSALLIGALGLALMVRRRRPAGGVRP